MQRTLLATLVLALCSIGISGENPRPGQGFVEVPGGRFTMGHEHIVEAEAPNPPHEVKLSPFRIGMHPVTNAEYAAFVADTGALRPAFSDHPTWGSPSRPVVGVSFAEAT